MNILPSEYDAATVLASLLIASLSSYVALDLAKRQRTRERGAALAWWIGGSVVMGTGIWCMHFVGMLAFSLPIPLGYRLGPTLVSWVAGVAVSAVALCLAGRRSLGPWSLGGGSLAMGAGISAMHYTGMAALDMAPGIVWNPWLVLASAVIAVMASAASLLIFFGLRKLRPDSGPTMQALAALAMGLAICGMHYTGMAAAQFPVGAVCLSADALAGDHLGTLVGLSSVALLALMLFTSILDARLQSRNARLASSLRERNEQLRQANEALSLRALQDPLTELPNRALFDDRLRHAIDRCTRAGGPSQRIERIAVMFVDLDGFKAVNDSLGHEAGDALLRQAAARLRAAARASDTVARIGGDEFVLLLEGVSGVSDGVSLAQRLIADLALPYDTGTRKVEISASIGLVVYPDQCDQDKLLARADAAMYAAKRTGGNTYALFESRMDSDVEQQLSLQGDLRHAVERGQLELHYQPKVESRCAAVCAVEALVRWRHPELGLIAPGVFIPLAERFGLVGQIGHWVIDEACRQIRAWKAQGVHLPVAINLSMHQLREAHLVPHIAEALARHGVAPDQLLCEITESVAMEDLKATQRTFEGLARLGVYVSIDDFGTGYSSLSHLRQLPARQLKIDCSFVKDLEGSSDARAIVSAIIRLAHELSLRVVAEGVETAGQRDILVSLGCDELQGYFYARPMPPDRLLAWMSAPTAAAEAAAAVAPSLSARPTYTPAPAA
jgi:diguanylate cyclase (GGDEF)-like protein